MAATAIVVSIATVIPAATAPTAVATATPTASSSRIASATVRTTTSTARLGGCGANFGSGTHLEGSLWRAGRDGSGADRRVIVVETGIEIVLIAHVGRHVGARRVFLPLLIELLLLLLLQDALLLKLLLLLHAVLLQLLLLLGSFLLLLQLLLLKLLLLLNALLRRIRAICPKAGPVKRGRGEILLRRGLRLRLRTRIKFALIVVRRSRRLGRVLRPELRPMPEL